MTQKCVSDTIIYVLLFLVAQSCLTLRDPVDCSPSISFIHGGSPGNYTGVGVSCHDLIQRIFPTQGLNPGLPHCRWILYHLSHQGSTWILKWVAYPFSRGSSQSSSGNQTRVSCIAGGFLTTWATTVEPQFDASFCLFQIYTQEWDCWIIW